MTPETGVMKLITLLELWKSMVPHILQNIFLCVQQNKDIHTGLELLDGE